MENQNGKENLTDKYVKPHKKFSRSVMEGDMDRVFKDSVTLYKLCYAKTGPYASAFAVAHPQIDDKDPLRFFVTKDREIIINPVIQRHTNALILEKEGCMTYPAAAMTPVGRYYKCEVLYKTMDGKKLIEKHEKMKGTRARIFQHEINHLDAIYIYDGFEKDTK